MINLKSVYIYIYYISKDHSRKVRCREANLFLLWRSSKEADSHLPQRIKFDVITDFQKFSFL